MLKNDEVNAILALGQHVAMQLKQLASGLQPLEINYAMLCIINRINTASMLASHPISAEQQQLLKHLRRVQSMTINGNNPHGKNTHLSCDLDLVCFPGLFSLRIAGLSIRNIQCAINVVELALVDCAVGEDFYHDAFLALRSIEFERTAVNSKYLASLAYTLRRFSIKHNDQDMDKTVWRMPPAEAGLMPWHALTHVTVRTHRPIFQDLDHSWERLVNLAVLSLTSMGLTDLRGLDVLKHCVNLVSLDLSYNQLTSVQRLAAIAPSLGRLNVSHNSITAIDGIPDLKELRHLSLEGNTIHEWAELRDVAEGCLKLQTLDLRGNPILSQIDEQHEVIPFVASIFQFRPLVVDGVRSETTRRKVTAEFLGKHMGLFERHRSLEGAASERMTAPTRGRPRTTAGSEAPPRAVSHRNEDAETFHSTRRSMRSVASERGTESGAPRGKRRIVRGKIQPDKQEASIDLPAPQLETIDPTSPSYVDVENLSEKHKERWLTAVSAQAAVTNRAKKKEVVVSTKETAQQPTPPAARHAVVEAVPSPPAVVVVKKKIIKKVLAKPDANTPSAASGAPSRGTIAAKASTAAVAGHGSSDDGVDEDEDIAAKKAISVKAAMASASSGGGGGTTSSSSSKPQRQVPLRDPTPLFQAFLQSLSGMDWAYVENDKKLKGFPSGCQSYLSAICAENEALWGIREDSTSLIVHHTAVEVLLHDSKDARHTTEDRHIDKKLVRVVEWHYGSTRAVRVETAIHEDKTMLPSFDARPVTTVLFAAALPTQPVDPHIEVRTGLPARKRGSFNGNRDRSMSELDWADQDIDTSRISRDILRVMRPTLLAAFVVEHSLVGDMFVATLKSHIETCHSRLCETKIMREWPLYLDETAVKRDSERSVRLDMTVANVLDRMKTNTDEDVNRQRIGANVMISGEELRINLTTEVFPKIARERFLASVYGNLVQVDHEGDESAVLLVLTQKTFVLALDHNYRGRGGCMGPDTAFEHVKSIPMQQIKVVTVSFNLQTIRVHQFVIQLRDSGSVLSVLSNILNATDNATVIEVAPCRYKDITTAPLIFSVGLFMRVPNKGRQVDRETTAFPLRHIEESMIPVSFVMTATDVVLLMEQDTMTEYASVKKLARRQLSTIVAFGVAVEALNPLLFSIHYTNLEKGKREQWVFAAQHPNTIAAVYSELRQTLGQRMNVVDFTEKNYLNGL